MPKLSKQYIRNTVADSTVIYNRGIRLYKQGSFFLSHRNDPNTIFTYLVDGNYGNYETRIDLSNDQIRHSCSCPYPGDMLKGEHIVVTPLKKKYRVTLHDPLKGTGHCSCPDYMTAGLGTCKHMIFLTSTLKKARGFKKNLARETFPFVDIFWNASTGKPGLFAEDLEHRMPDLKPILDTYFTQEGTYRLDELSALLSLLDDYSEDKRIKFQETLLERIDRELQEGLAKEDVPRAIGVEPALKTQLYPYQKQGVEFGVLKPGVLIGDEMGLGKTLQGIALGILKKEIFGFSRILVVTLASLKEQWKREIEKFSCEKASIIAGTPDQRKDLYGNTDSLFKITNYEAVLRDGMTLAQFNADLVILDEVIKELPDEVVNNYYIDLSREQQDIHAGFARSLIPLLHKKFLTPVDLRRMQTLLLRMRQICNSTFLIDRETQISPKLKELEGIVEEVVLQNKRKMVIFSEWTTMTYLIANYLSNAGIPFVELSGKVPVAKRQPLIDEFTNNPEYRAFLYHPDSGNDHWPENHTRGQR